MKSWAKWFADRVARRGQPKMWHQTGSDTICFGAYSDERTTPSYGARRMVDGWEVYRDDSLPSINMPVGSTAWRDQLRFEIECDRDQRNG